MNRIAPLCPYCGGASTPAFTSKDWNQRTSEERFAYCTCKGCSLTFIERVPEDLPRYYVNEQYDVPKDASGFQGRAESQQWKVGILQSLAAGGALIEIGPATGEFALLSRQAGFDPMLFEMNSDCCKFLRDSLNLEVVQGSDPAQFLQSARACDVVCIWQAIEHIPRFWKSLEAATHLLRSGGVLLMSTPNPESLQAKILGRYWPHIDAPRHLYLIPPGWMRRFAQSNGLSVALQTTRDSGSTGLNYYGWYLAIRNATRTQIGRASWRGRV